MSTATRTHHATRRGAPPPLDVCLLPLFPASVWGCLDAWVLRDGWGWCLGATELARAAVTRPLASGGLPTVGAYGSMLVCVLGVQCSTVSWAGPRLMVEARFLVVTAPVLRQVCLAASARVGPVPVSGHVSPPRCPVQCLRVRGSVCCVLSLDGHSFVGLSVLGLLLLTALQHPVAECCFCGSEGGEPVEACRCPCVPHRVGEELFVGEFAGGVLPAVSLAAGHVLHASRWCRVGGAIREQFGGFDDVQV